MISKINSVGLTGMEGYSIQVETDVSAGVPAWEVVGIPDIAVRESKERIRTAVKHAGFQIPGKRIVVNLAPAGVKKEGAYFDLPIAIGMLISSEQINPNDLSDCAFFGELSLDGKLRGIRGALPMAITAFQNGIKKIFLPEENAKEAAVVAEAEVYGVNSLAELIKHITGKEKIKRTIVDIDKLFRQAAETELDFSEVRGQQGAKRALEVAAAGGHNLLLIGPPGSGKTMLAQRIPSILPELSFEEALEVTKVHSIAGTLSENQPMVLSRPFRSSHHTVSAVGLAGGGSTPRPGEVSLAHHGVLFLDELPEFRKDALEILRQPLEDGSVTITRAGGTYSYPCNIMLVASMNPCPCGYYGDKKHDCGCSLSKIKKYLGKVSGPLLDRIDLHIEVPAVEYDDLEQKSQKAESSAEIKKRVNNARQIQLKRYKGTGIYSNSQLTPALMEKFCNLTEEGSLLLRGAFDDLGMSARAHNRILKVARTIADLEGSEKIQAEHLAEAIQYRSLDRKFWS
ncbi:MAG: YifB family Mg chelatase-like AAA ATPase [Clostridia bacterium]|nr:YifB family Mg chelatase-like AAA ATPase [Clostridia bacterium]